jgi:tetratricopeptide (TPR) repeat protein
MPEREDIFQKAMNEGHSAAWDQDWKKAAAEYRKALQEMPDQPKALNSLGLALYQLGEFEEALSIYQHLAKFSPDDPVTWEKIAQLSERVGELDTAVEAAMKAAEGFFSQRDIEKSIENWSRVTTLNPEHVLAHSRLAVVHERLGQKQPAVTEYLAIASILQRGGRADKAQEIVTKALQLMPQSAEARQAQSLLKTGQLLPRPLQPKGGTAPLSMAKVRQLQEPRVRTDSGLDPIAETRQKALTKLAEMLFDYSDESPAAQERRGLSAIVRGTGQISLQQAEQAKVVLHLGQAIDAQTNNQDTIAADELDRALEAGFDHAALYFDLGYLRSGGDRLESAIRCLAHAVKHKDYALGSRLLLGDILFKRGQVKDAALEYLEALKLADSITAPPEQSDDIRQLYEPLIEAQQNQKDETINRNICKNIRNLLLRADWRDEIYKTREQTRKGEEGASLAPLAEVLLEAQSSSVIESINLIHQLARAGSLRSAMDEAFDAVQHAPTYLPLHTLMGDLLIQEGRTQDAIAKFSVVAHSYGVRGEVGQASKLLRRIIQLSPMDLSARTRLIDQLVARGQVDDAINEYLELAELYYRLAELDMARKTYTNALRVVQQTDADHSWNIHILQRMADIDMQRLDWKQALRVYEQIRTLRPDDQAIRKQLIELYARMGQEQQATSELESFLTYLESNGKTNDALLFLEGLAKEHEDELLFLRALAEQLHRMGRTEEAVSRLDALGETLLQGGKNKEAAAVITQILLMNPPNAEGYRELLAQIPK